jgi:hypothetical protein
VTFLAQHDIDTLFGEKPRRGHTNDAATNNDYVGRRRNSVRLLQGSFPGLGDKIGWHRFGHIGKVSGRFSSMHK